MQVPAALSCDVCSEGLSDCLLLEAFLTEACMRRDVWRHSAPGFDGESSQDSVEAYDARAGRWRPVAAMSAGCALPHALAAALILRDCCWGKGATPRELLAPSARVCFWRCTQR